MQVRSVSSFRYLTTTVLVVGLLALGAQSAWAQVAAQQSSDVNTLRADVRRLSNVVNDRFAGERELREARVALQAGLEAMNQAMTVVGDDDRDVVDETAELRLQTAELIASIDRRVPSGVLGAVKGPVDRNLIAVPDFEAGTNLAERAETLRAAYAAVMEEMVQAGDGRGSRDQVPVLVLAQQELAWAAGWPFSREEVDLLRSVSAAPTTESSQKAFVEVYNRRTSRGVERINKSLAEEARFNGRARLGPFVLFRAAGADQQRDIERRLLESMSDEMGLTVADAEPLRGFSVQRTRSFDEFEAWRLRQR